MPRLLLYYHFFHPSDVVSARQFSDLGAEQAARGWEVTAVTSDRAWHDPALRYPPRERWRGVEIHRVHRPAWPQSRALTRLGNSAYLLGAWAHHSRTLPPVDAIVIGSDPAFAALLALPLARLRPRTPIVHWCFDLYPEAIEAEGKGAGAGAGSSLTALGVPVARRLMAAAYRRCDTLVDIGSTMRRRLAAYGTPARHATLPPWALVEPERPSPIDLAARAALFPAETRLALLYAGTMGRAHDFELLLELARACRARSGRAIGFCFACRGNRLDELRAAVRAEDVNVTFAPFGTEAELPARLAAADLHVVSLRPEWQGLVVPSKFFASLAVGRPVLFAGPADSEITDWIAELGVGLAIHGPADCAAAVEALHRLALGPAELAGWQAEVHARYAESFSKLATNDRWDRLLREIVARARTSPSAPAGTSARFHP
jgi:glycosyltransferase involved in cell wall biosynthesis